MDGIIKEVKIGIGELGDIICGEGVDLRERMRCFAEECKRSRKVSTGKS